jgi:hypothetical protein
MADVTRDEQTQTVSTVTYALTGPDNVAFTAVVTASSVQITSDDPAANANVTVHLSSLPALLALLASVQANAVAAPAADDDTPAS